MLALACEHGLSGSIGDDTAARLDRDHPVDERQHVRDAVLDHDHRYIAALHDARDHLANRTRAVGVEVRGGLVEEQDARAERKDPGDREALLLAARKRGGRAVLAVREADVGERAVDARPDLGGGDAPVLETEGDVVAGARHDELRVRVLEHQTGIATDAELALLVRSAGPVEQAGESLEERALPGARGSH